MLGIEPYAVRVEEFLIVQVVLDLVIHHADALQRRVGARTHGPSTRPATCLHRLIQYGSTMMILPPCSRA